LVETGTCNPFITGHTMIIYQQATSIKTLLAAGGVA
jgi:hypothetical protein